MQTERLANEQMPARPSIYMQIERSAYITERLFADYKQAASERARARQTQFKLNLQPTGARAGLGQSATDGQARTIDARDHRRGRPIDELAARAAAAADRISFAPKSIVAELHHWRRI